MSTFTDPPRCMRCGCYKQSSDMSPIFQCPNGCDQWPVAQTYAHPIIGIDQPFCHGCTTERAAREKAEAEVKSLLVKLRVWYDVFGTTQLTHAKARLEAAESKREKAEAMLMEIKGIVGFPGTIALEKHGLSESLPDVVRYCHREWLSQTHAAQQRVIGAEMMADKAEAMLREGAQIIDDARHRFCSNECECDACDFISRYRAEYGKEGGDGSVEIPTP